MRAAAFWFIGVERTDWDAEFFMVLSIGWIVSMHIHNIRPVVDRLGHQPDIASMGARHRPRGLCQPQFPGVQKPRRHPQASPRFDVSILTGILTSRSPNIQKPVTRESYGLLKIGVPTGIRTPVLTVKGWCPDRARRWGLTAEPGTLRPDPLRATSKFGRLIPI